MSQHPTDALLERFIAGDLDDDVAVAVAEHIDACPHCAARAVHGDPLAAAFASVQDPPMPEGLVEDILRAADEAQAAENRPLFARPELWAASGLLAAATVLLALTGGLTPWLADLGVSVRAALVGGGVLLSSSPVPTGAVAIAATTVLVISGLAILWVQRDRRG